jgi:hypothetical protein
MRIALIFVLFVFNLTTANCQNKGSGKGVVDPVRLQLIGYNARDIDIFVKAFSDSVKVFRQPGVLTYQGKDELRKRYGAMFAATPDLNCKVVKRIIAGNVVIDHEKVLRTKGQPRTDAIAVYRIQNGEITEVTFIPPHKN